MKAITEEIPRPFCHADARSESSVPVRSTAVVVVGRIDRFRIAPGDFRAAQEGLPCFFEVQL
jgi:hypothetical protein